MTSNSYGGLEVFFDYQVIAGHKITVKTDVNGLQDYPASLISALFPVWIQIEAVEDGGQTYIVARTLINNVTVDASDFNLECPGVDILRCRLVMDNLTISITCNDVEVYTYTMSDASWPEIAKASILSTGANTLLNVSVSELSDPREAVYIDYEQTTESAIQSIIQQRPIQQFAEVGRLLSFTYSAIRDTVAAHHIFSYTETTRDNGQLSSDGLVYFADVTVSLSPETAKQVGLITRLYRLSELNNGAKYAAFRMQKFALEKRKTVAIACRLDPRLQIADRLTVDQIVTGTGTHIVDDLIVEDISIAVQSGSYSMNINARRRF